MDQLTLNLDLQGLQVPYLSEYLGAWAMPERYLASLARLAEQMDLRAHIREAQKRREAEAQAADSDAPRLRYLVGVSDEVALVQVSGTLMKHASSLDESTSTLSLRRTLRALRASEEVRGVLLAVDSPGGSVAGTLELGEDLAALAAAKPTWCAIEDLGASAAYWAASQCSRITANTTAWVGSIGTLAIIYDYSGAAAQAGIKVHVISTGPYKGAGTPGSEIKPDHLAHWQHLVDETNGHFLDAVARGRRMSRQQVEQLADGRVHPAGEALKAGLIDAVQSLEKTLADLKAETKKKRTISAGGRSASETPIAAQNTANTPGPQNEETSMSVQQTQAPGGAQTGSAAETLSGATEPRPATIAELRAAYPDDPAFALEAAENAWTATEAEAAYAKVLRKRLAEQSPKPGVKALGGRSTGGGGGAGSVSGDSAGGGDAIAQFNAAVRAQMPLCGHDRRKAVLAVCRQQEELHRAYLEASNPGRKARSLIGDRFEGE